MIGIAVSTANTDQVMAWKNGIFNFEHIGLEEMLRQLSRWYDVDVTIAGRFHTFGFAGR